MSKPVKLNNIKPNLNNPRLIKDDKFKKLVKSIQDFPEMMEKRPIVCVTDTDGKLYPLGGNMRFKALQEIGYKDIPETWVVLADEWTVEQRNEFVIKDNVGFGEWDWEQLANEWDAEKLDEWGLDVWEKPAEVDKIPSKTDLIEKTQLYRRTNFSYVSIFKKSKTGVELSKIKEKDNEYMDRFIFVLYENIKNFVKNKRTCVVCPPPRRHKEWNLAQQLVLGIAKYIKVNTDIELFKANTLSKFNPDIELTKELIFDNYVIIDDIITTGQTIDKCIELLDNKNIFVFCLIDNN